MQSDNKFKIILTVVFAVFILLGFLAFATFKSKSSSNAGVQVSIWGTMNHLTFEAFKSKLEQDNSIVLNVNYTQKDISNIYSDTIEAVAIGKAPDVVLIPQDIMKFYLDKVYLIPTSLLPTRTFEDTFVGESNLYIQPGGVFGLPFFIDPLVMYWNKDTFFSAGIPTPPKTWQEFPDLVTKLSQTDANANVTKSTVSFGEYENINNAKAILSALIMQTGSDIVSSNNDGTFTSDLSGDKSKLADAALSFYTQFSNPKKAVYSWNRSLPSAKQMFLSEDLATYFGFGSEAPDIKAKNPNLNFDVAVIPQASGANSKATFGEMYGFAILRSSPNFQPSYDLISLLTEKDAVDSFLTLTNYSPARFDVISEPNADPIKTIFYNSSLIARGWIDPSYTKTDDIFKGMVEDISSGRLDVPSSVQKASDELNNLL